MAYPIIDTLTGRFVMDNGNLLPVGDPAARILLEPCDRTMYYEVIRLVDKVPLFWEEHYDRLCLSVRPPVEIPRGLYADCLELVRANGIAAANLRLVLLENRAVIHLTESAYPSPELFSRGVVTGILDWERENPNIKSIRSDYKAAVAARFAQSGPFGRCYELLLADRQGYLTEGSRSNLFFIQGSTVLSAGDDRILKGVTRRHVLEAIDQAGGQLKTGLLTLEDIRSGGCDAAFLSSSPFDILPIRTIEDVQLDSAENSLLIAINAAYNEAVKRYVAARKIQ